MSLHDEFQLIDLIKKTVPRPSKRVELGIGDDAAVLTTSHQKIIVTNDAMVEGVHFDLAYTTAKELGHKIMAVNLSDCAAMAARPRYAVVSLGLKQELNEYFVEELYSGICELAKRHKVDIVGGNISQSPTAIFVDLTLIGEPLKSYAKRSGARPTDVLAVTGWLGNSAAGLNGIKRLGRSVMEDYRPLVESHLRPNPRIEEAIRLLEVGGLTAMMDLSDGLGMDLHHLLKASKVGALIDAKKIPISTASKKVAKLINANAMAWALYGGEDYELLVTISEKKFSKAQKALKALGCSLTPIGVITKFAEGAKLKTVTGELTPFERRGWNHFVRRSRLRTE